MFPPTVCVAVKYRKKGNLMYRLPVLYISDSIAESVVSNVFCSIRESKRRTEEPNVLYRLPFLYIWQPCRVCSFKQFSKRRTGEPNVLFRLPVLYIWQPCRVCSFKQFSKRRTGEPNVLYRLPVLYIGQHCSNAEPVFLNRSLKAWSSFIVWQH